MWMLFVTPCQDVMWKDSVNRLEAGWAVVASPSLQSL